MRIRSRLFTEFAFAPQLDCAILKTYGAIGTKWQETERILPRLSSQIECRREQCLLMPRNTTRAQQIRKALLWMVMCSGVILGSGFPVPAARGEEARSGYAEDEDFGGPSSTASQLEEDDQGGETVFRFQWLEESMAPYYGFKKDLHDDYGLSFGADYTAVLQKASQSPGTDEATGGIFRAYGTWQAIGRDSGNTGTLTFKVENRHDLGTQTAPQDLGFGIGYGGITAAAFSDYRNEGWGLTNLFWQQRIAEGRISAVVGLVDSTDYIDIYGLVSPWLHFTNLAFSTNPTIAAPNQGIGVALGAKLTDQIYLIGGVADANGDPVDPIGSIDTFFDDKEYFKHIEIGYTSGRDRLYLDNIHLTLWHADERTDAGVPDGWGIALSYAWFFDDRWMPFIRAGYAEDGGALYEGSVSGGLGYYIAERRDVLGIGLNWSRPSDTAIAPGLDDQYSVELFYRIQISQSLAITPDVQLIVDPALNPDDDSIFVAGLRLRLAL